MSSYEEVIEKDIELIWSIKKYCHVNPWITNIFSSIVSKYPFRDIVIILWVFFAVGIAEIGVRHLWVCLFNFLFAIFLRRIIEAKRPVEFDPRLKPTTELSPESYGFPSLESYMSVVIMGHIFFSLRSIILLPLGIFVIFIVGFSRVYSCSRFPHQIVGSWLLGFAGLLIFMHICERRVQFHAMTDFEHNSYFGFFFLGIAAYVAICMENNDSRILYIPKGEFKRVMVEILSGGRKDGAMSAPAGAISNKNEANNSILGSASTVTDTPRSIATKQAQEKNPTFAENSVKKKRYIKSDSLYYLQKSLEERETRLKKEALINAAATARRAKQLYGDEDFFSSDTETTASR